MNTDKIRSAGPIRTSYSIKGSTPLPRRFQRAQRWSQRYGVGHLDLATLKHMLRAEVEGRQG